MIMSGDNMISIQEKNLFNRFSHEIKNPLTICSGYLEMLENQDSNNPYIKIIQSEIKRSISLINEYTKSQTLWIQKFDLATLLEEIQNILNPLFQENNAEIILFPMKKTFIYGDYEKLKQALINILKNAKEAQENEKLLIVIQQKETCKFQQIIITDNGIGMTKEELNKIAEDYYTTKEQGMGLGVSQIMETIKKHNGKIEYKSEKSKGTQIIIELPKKKKS